MRYAVNFHPSKMNCFEESLWNTVSPEWTEEILTNEIYQCEIVKCPYGDAQLNDFIDDDDNIKFSEMKYQERKEAEKMDSLRSKRQPLLVAFDKYNMLVMRNIIIETNEQFKQIKGWYAKILDLDEAALQSPPEEIIKFL